MIVIRVNPITTEIQNKTWYFDKVMKHYFHADKIILDSTVPIYDIVVDNIPDEE